ncbi:hypothetical protein CRM22_004295 [Opisthorchis felineus]|uniref:Uncharacterized protein n=1 Tax=Opisthorchis felineus TaxID=147828 RepID=A0A4S2LWR5_OPIFE|nr:hypothetical protein CRM22_004295 [Opisthorchis felineus]
MREKQVLKFRMTACMHVLLKIFERAMLVGVDATQITEGTRQFARQQSCSAHEAGAYLTYSLVFYLFAKLGMVNIFRIPSVNENILLILWLILTIGIQKLTLISARIGKTFKVVRQIIAVYWRLQTQGIAPPGLSYLKSSPCL